MVPTVDKTSFKLRRKVQHHDFALPLALRKIVYKPLAVKSIVPTLLRPTRECLPERDLEMWLHWDLLGA